MSAIVVIQFNHTMSQPELGQSAAEFSAEVVPTIPGLEWKIYLNRPADLASGGVYFFDSFESAQGYVDSEIVAGLVERFPNATVAAYETLEEASRATGAPIPIAEPA